MVVTWRLAWAKVDMAKLAWLVTWQLAWAKVDVAVGMG